VTHPQAVAQPVLITGYVGIEHGRKTYWIPRHARPAVRKLWRAWRRGRPFVRLVGDGDSLGGLVVPGPERGGPAGTVCLAFVGTADVLGWCAWLI
jgi:hypothetical protein